MVECYNRADNRGERSMSANGRCTLQHSWKASLKNMIPPALLNAILLRFPSLYGTKLVFYETNLQKAGEIDELLAQMAMAMDVDGDIIECGSSRCGTSIIMANCLRARQLNKKIL